MLATAGLFTACSSESAEPTGPEVTEFEGIQLAISNPAGTRATNFANTTANELKVQDLTVIAYSTTDATKPTTVVDATDTELTSVQTNSNNGNYTLIRVPLAPGNYHIYVIANKSDYILKNGENYISDFRTLSETDLKSSRFVSMSPIPFEDVNDGKSYLPMSCNTDELKTSATGTDTFGSGIVNVSKKSITNVYADLTFCVSKVRVTILNGTTNGLYLGDGFSATNGVKVKKYATQVGALTGISASIPLATDGTDDSALTGSYYTLPQEAKDNPEHWTIANLDASTAITDADNAKTTWAWQTIYYVPENLYKGSEDASKTQVSLSFNNSVYNKTRSLGTDAEGLVRGKYYDVLGYTNAKQINIQVRVNEWRYHKYTTDLDEFE